MSRYTHTEVLRGLNSTKDESGEGANSAHDRLQSYWAVFISFVAQGCGLRAAVVHTMMQGTGILAPERHWQLHRQEQVTRSHLPAVEVGKGYSWPIRDGPAHQGPGRGSLYWPKSG